MKRSTALKELSISFKIIVESHLFNINSILTILIWANCDGYHIFEQIEMVKYFLTITAINAEAGKGNNHVTDRKGKKGKNSKHVISDKEKL